MFDESLRNLASFILLTYNTNFIFSLLFVAFKCVKSLNHALSRIETVENDNIDDDETVDILLENGATETKEVLLQERMAERKFEKLFDNCKFFISREVSREMMVFMIR